ncbi:MAG: hypothetical protein IH588_11290 [Anaerolineales bacterium]|nr:hypothetical protein [Anaerolineales bacterium]
MTDQLRSTFHKKLAAYVADECFDETQLRIFDALIEEKYSLSLEELVNHVFGKIPDNEQDSKYDKAEEERQVQEGIRGLQRLAIPILLEEDGGYFLGDDEDSIEELIGYVETDMELLREQYSWMNFHHGRMFEKLGW